MRIKEIALEYQRKKKELEELISKRSLQADEVNSLFKLKSEESQDKEKQIEKLNALILESNKQITEKENKIVELTEKANLDLSKFTQTLSDFKSKFDIVENSVKLILYKNQEIAKIEIIEKEKLYSTVKNLFEKGDYSHITLVHRDKIKNLRRNDFLLNDIAPDTSLDKLTSVLEDKIIIKDFVNIVGSSIDDSNKQPKDLDILVRLSDVDFIKRAVHTHLLKKLNELGINKPLHLFLEPEGPHDDFIPIYNLKLELAKPFKKIKMEDIDLSDKLIIPYLPQKPYGSAYYDIAELINKLDEKQEYYVEKKYNGFHVSVIKKGDSIQIFSEQKKDITKPFLTLIKEIKKLNFDFIVDGEIVPYDEKGKALGRAPLMKFMGAVKSGKEIDDSLIKLHVWDCLKFGDKDIRILPLYGRKKYLEKFNFTKRLTNTPYKSAKGRDSLKGAINWATDLEDSEGAIIKVANSTYTFDEKSKSWLKYRRLVDIDCVVLEQNKTAIESTFNYHIGIYLTKDEIDEINPKRILDFDDKKILDLKNTFNTAEIFKKGDIISVSVEEIWRHKTKEGIYYSAHKPKIMHLTDKKETSTLKDLDNIVVSIGEEVIENEELAEKIPEEGKDIEPKDFPQDMQKYMNLAKEEGKWFPFVMQWHYRGHVITDKERKEHNIPEKYTEWLRSLHNDLRLAVPDKTGKLDHCEGITILSPTSTDKSVPDLINKQDFKNVRCVLKKPPPLGWLKVEGVYEKGAPGATEASAVFVIVAKGIYKPIIIEDHRLIVQFKPQTGKVNRDIFDKADKKGIYIDRKPLDNLKDLPEYVNFHIAHIDERHIILGDKIKEENIK